MRRTVVHIITDLKDGGAQGVLARLCVHDKQSRHVVISLMDEGKYGPLLEKAGITVLCVSMHPARPSLTKFFKLIRLIKAERPDVVQTWMYHADLLGGLATPLAGGKRVFWGVRQSRLKKGTAKRSTILVAYFCAWLSRRVPEKIICCANKAKDSHATIGYEKSKLVVIQNGYDLSRFKLDCDLGASIRKELALNPVEFVLGSVGRFHPQKDHFNLLQALVLVAQQHIEFRCLLVGTGLSSDNDLLVERIVDLGLEEKVLLLGQRTDIPAVMNALDLHVLSSRSEGFPNVLAEAMACGVPCASTDVGDVLDIIGDPNACCPPRDPHALANVISNLHQEWQSDPDAWQLRKGTGVQRVADRFSMKKMVAAYETCWFGSQELP